MENQNKKPFHSLHEGTPLDPMDDGETQDPRFGEPHSVSMRSDGTTLLVDGTPYQVPRPVWEAMGQGTHSMIVRGMKIKALRVMLAGCLLLVLSGCGIVDTARDAGREIHQAVEPDPPEPTHRLIHIGPDSVTVDTCTPPMCYPEMVPEPAPAARF